MDFCTYGPFELDEWSPAGVDALYAKFEAEREDLQKAMGVYIVACSHNGKLIPWYVGKTDKNFGTRLFQQFDGSVFENIYKRFGNMSLFLISRVTPKGRLKKRSKSTARLKSIDRLEFALIGTCIAINPELVNKQEKTFHTSIKVPGYWNSPVADHDSSAKKLAKMLGGKR